MPPLRVAAIGTGWVTSNRHLPWLKKTDGIEVVGVIDRHRDHVAAAQRRFGIPRSAVAERASDVPWLDDVDAVTIGAAPMAHYELTLDYLAAGKHVLVEKPMAMTPAQAHEMIEAAARRGLVLAVVHNFQFARSVARARRLLESGELGPLRGVWGIQLSNVRRRLPSWYEQLPRGLFYDESPHFFYLLRSFLGTSLRVVSASAIVPPRGRSTPLSLSVTVDGGRAPGKIDMNFDSPISEWQFLVYGERRLAMVDIFRDAIVVFDNDGEHSARQIMKTSFDGIRGHLRGVVASGALLMRDRLAYGNDEVLRRFRVSCTSGIAPPGISSRDGAAVVELQHAALERVAAGS